MILFVFPCTVFGITLSAHRIFHSFFFSFEFPSAFTCLTFVLSCCDHTISSEMWFYFTYSSFICFLFDDLPENSKYFIVVQNSVPVKFCFYCTVLSSQALRNTGSLWRSKPSFLTLNIFLYFLRAHLNSAVPLPSDIIINVQ